MAPPFTFHFLGRQPQRLGNRAGLGGEGFVGFDEVEIADAPAGLGQCRLRGRYRADAHDRGIDADGGPGSDARQRCDPPALGFFRGHQHEGRGASLIPEALPAVTVPSLVKAGRSFLKRVERGAGAWIFVCVDDLVAGLAARHRDRDDLVLEAPRLHRLLGLMLTGERNSSCWSRVTWYWLATFSAVTPM